MSDGAQSIKSAFGKDEYCTDQDHGFGNENSLDIHKMWIEASTITGVSDTKLGAPDKISYQSYYPQAAVAFNAMPGLTWSGSVKPAIAAIADSHPGEPVVSIPNFVYEMKDIPGMLKHAYGRAKSLHNAASSKDFKSVKEYLSSPKSAAEDWLNYHFGWMPLVSDLKDIAKVSKETQKKLVFLEGNSKGYISRRRDLGTRLGRSSTPSSTYDSGFILINGRAERYSTEENWVVSHWRVNLPSLQAIKSNQLALYGNALGFGDMASNIWNAMPWTWLTDWFVDVGSVIDIYSNKFGVSFANAMTMRHTLQRTVVSAKPGKGMPYCPDQIQYEEWKTRSPYSPAFNLAGSMHLLGPSQLATLAALSVTRTRIAGSF